MRGSNPLKVEVPGWGDVEHADYLGPQLPCLFHLVSEELLRTEMWLMRREKTGDVATKNKLEGRKLETLVEMCLMALNGVGLVIGLGAAGARALRRRGTGNQPSVCA